VKPSVGRIVHYVSYGTPGGEYKSECRAAIITEVTEHPDADMTAGLCVLNPTGLFLNRGVPCDLGPAESVGTNLCGGLLYRGGTWHWPERVE
jgi:hypothetical protein